MTNARILKLAYDRVQNLIDKEVQRVIDYVKAGKDHSLEDADLAKYYVEREELYRLLRQAERDEEKKR